jgi:hypothetical protein
MTTDDPPKTPEHQSHDGDASIGEASTQSHLPQTARDGSEKSKPYLLVKKPFKGDQDYFAKPSAYEKRRATESVDDEGQIGPAMTVRFIKLGIRCITFSHSHSF